MGENGRGEHQEKRVSQKKPSIAHKVRDLESIGGEDGEVRSLSLFSTAGERGGKIRKN